MWRGCLHIRDLDGQEHREDDFVPASTELAVRTNSDLPNETASLLLDRDQSNRFVSFGPWDSLEQIQQRRASETFKQGVAKLRELPEEFAPHTMDLAAIVE